MPQVIFRQIDLFSHLYEEIAQMRFIPDFVMPRYGKENRSPTSRGASLKCLGVGVVSTLLCLTSFRSASAADEAGYLGSIRRHNLIGSTVPANGDQNPYAVVVAPTTSGKLHQGDVIVDNFNDKNNLQGLGTTIVSIDPATKKLTLFAAIPRHLASCPGGVGLTTAMAVLKTGWVIVGSLPSQDGTTATKGPGCLIVLDNQGNVVNTIAGPNIDGPWGNMAVIDNGNTAALFVSMTGFGVGAPVGETPPAVNRATVLRIGLSIPDGKPPVVTSQTVIADGLGERADKDVFIIGPTGLCLHGTTLYVSDAIGNRVAAIPDAVTRTTSAGVGQDVTKEGLLKRPLAMTMASNGHLLVINGLNGQVVEIDPTSGKQIYARWIDANKAQDPPGSGDLFGIAMTPDGNGFYFVQDEVNMLVFAH